MKAARLLLLFALCCRALASDIILYDKPTLRVYITDRSTTNSGTVGLNIDYLTPPGQGHRPVGIVFRQNGKPIYDVARDANSEDFDLLYSHNTLGAPQRSGDVFRHSPDGRWILGPSVGETRGNEATLTLVGGIGSKDGILIRQFSPQPTAMDGIRLLIYNDHDANRLAFEHAAANLTWRMGISATDPQRAFALYGVRTHRDLNSMKSDSAPDKPGVEMLSIDLNGDLKVKGALNLNEFALRRLAAQLKPYLN